MGTPDVIIGSGSSSNLATRGPGSRPIYGRSTAVSDFIRRMQLLRVKRPEGLSSPVPWEEYSPYQAPIVTLASSRRASEFDLMLYAERGLGAVQSDPDASPTQAAIASARQLLRELIAADGPTPQVGATQSGSIEIQWLVAGYLVSVLLESDGGYNLYVDDPVDGVEVDVDVPPGSPIPSDEVARLRDRLAHMGLQVVQRPPDWTW